jgi:hypothetical protein
MKAATVVLVASVGLSAALGTSMDTQTLCESIDERLPCSVPELHTETAYGAAFGDFIGTATKDQITKFYSSEVSCPVFQDIFEISDTFQWFIKDYMNAHTTLFPTEQAELFAMAEAIGLPATTVFMQNACAELYLMFGADVKVNKFPQPINLPPISAPSLYMFGSSLKDKKNKGAGELRVRPRGGEHCSDVGALLADVRTKETRVVQGHNEDWWSSVASEMSIVHTPDWWGYAYPGQLPGTSFFVNNKGLSLSMNSLYPLSPGYTSESTTSRKGVAVVFAYALRSVMNATSTDEVVKQLSKFPIYSGYSLNVMSGCETSITNIEGYGDRLSVQSRRGLDQAGTIGHFNAYVNSAVDQDSEGTSSKRMECLDKADINSAGDIRNYLGNLDCPVFFTSLNGDHESETMSTFIADPTAGQCARYRLPAGCNLKKSRCYPNAPEPAIYKWDFQC